MALTRSSRSEVEPLQAAFDFCLPQQRPPGSVRTKEVLLCQACAEDYLYCLDDLPRAQEQSQVFMGEMHMDGVFVKFNNNGGSVNKEDHKHHCDLAQAFSHFTFDQSYGELLVVDIQGVPSVQSDGKTVLHLTDPQVHSRHNNFPSFGEGDLKEAGIRKSFATHRCSRICEALKLKRASDYDFLPPRITLTIPGLSHEFWKELSTRTLQKVRRQFRLADIVYPNEIIGEDLEVKLWGRLKNTSQAAQAISCSLEQLLHECCHPIWFEDAGFYLHQIQAMAPWSVRAFGWPRGGEAQASHQVWIYPRSAGPALEATFRASHFIAW